MVDMFAVICCVHVLRYCGHLRFYFSIYSKDYIVSAKNVHQKFTNTKNVEFILYIENLNQNQKAKKIEF